MQTITLHVEGMSCAHCQRAVEGAVGALAGVESVAVSLRDKTAIVRYDASKVAPEDIRREIEDQGYSVV